LASRSFGILIVRLAAVPGHAFGADLEPDQLLLGHRDAVDELLDANRSRLPKPPSSMTYSGSSSA
jgi:hypothetical protein